MISLQEFLDKTDWTKEELALLCISFGIESNGSFNRMHHRIRTFLLTNQNNSTDYNDWLNQLQRLNLNIRTNVLPEYEEDNPYFIEQKSSKDFISDEHEFKVCPNKDFINMQEYDINHNDIFSIYYLDTNSNIFKRGACISKSELQEYIKSEEIEDPSVISTIWNGGDLTGVGGRPSFKFVIKMPPDNVFVTLGSFHRMMTSTVKKWYLLPLYGGKKRRIGYKYGSSRNHGQIPGFQIFKVFTKNEIISGIPISETPDDFPIYPITPLDINNTDMIKAIKKVFVPNLNSDPYLEYTFNSKYILDKVYFDLDPGDQYHFDFGDIRFYDEGLRNLNKHEFDANIIKRDRIVLIDHGYEHILNTQTGYFTMKNIFIGIQTFMQEINIYKNYDLIIFEGLEDKGNGYFKIHFESL